MPNPADEYLAAALAIIEQHAMHRARIDWTALRLAAARHAAGAFTPADTYDTIRWLLTQLDDRHSFFAPPDRGDIAITSGVYDQEATVPNGHLRTDRIPAYPGLSLVARARNPICRYAPDTNRPARCH